MQNETETYKRNQSQSHPTQTNDDEKGRGESSAYEDTSGGYGTGGSTGNSSARDTGLGSATTTEQQAGNRQIPPTEEA